MPRKSRKQPERDRYTDPNNGTLELTFQLSVPPPILPDPNHDSAVNNTSSASAKGKGKAKETQDQYSTFTNMMTSINSSMPQTTGEAMTAKIQSLPIDYQKLIQGFRRGLIFPSLPPDIQCTRQTLRDPSCECKKCICRALIYYASLFVYHDLRMDSLAQGIDLESERARCPPLLDLGNGHCLYHALNISHIINNDPQLSMSLARPEHCFVYDSVTQGRYWWRNFPPRETWPAGRFQEITCPATVAAQWTVYLLNANYRFGLEFGGSIQIFIAMLQTKPLV
ncbi:hypothetical protein EV360DRAFT_80447 [Lentinula raphanica]|nr:hypothetical protein EV360DRAFT_80447 [Lentinula raphanica]